MPCMKSPRERFNRSNRLPNLWMNERAAEQRCERLRIEIHSRMNQPTNCTLCKCDNEPLTADRFDQDSLVSHRAPSSRARLNLQGHAVRMARGLSHAATVQGEANLFAVHRTVRTISSREQRAVQFLLCPPVSVKSPFVFPNLFPPLDLALRISVALRASIALPMCGREMSAPLSLHISLYG